MTDTDTELRNAIPPALEAEERSTAFNVAMAKLADVIAETLGIEAWGPQKVEPKLHIEGEELIGYYLAWKVLPVARSKGIEHAIGWMKRVARVQTTAATIYVAVRGLNVPSPCDLTTDVRLERIEGSAISERMKERIAHLNEGESRLPRIWAVISCRIPDYPIVTAKDSLGGGPWYRADRRLREVIDACSMIGPCAPIGDVGWIEFEDPDFADLRIHSVRGAQDEGGHVGIGWHFLWARDANLVSKYLTLEGPLAARLKIALNRLNLAQRRVSAGNKAIEAAICLEALLGEGRDELIFRYSLRAALLLGRNFEESDRIRRTIKAMYDLRSKVVHGHDPGRKPIEGLSPDYFMTQAIAICARLVRTFVEMGVVPDWNEIELRGCEKPPTMKSKPVV